MIRQSEIDAAMARGDSLSRMADTAYAEGQYERSMSLNREAYNAYTRAERLSIDLHEQNEHAAFIGDQS